MSARLFRGWKAQLQANARSDSYQWDLGSPFLKNVYTAFRFDPPAVGFGELSANAQPAVQPSAALRNGVSVAAVFMAVAAAVVL